MRKSLVILSICFSLITMPVYAAEQTQAVLLPPALHSPPPCGYYYNGNEDQNEASVTFSNNGNYSTETYSTKPKNPYPYYGNACNSGNVYSAVPYYQPFYPPYPPRPKFQEPRVDLYSHGRPPRQ